MTRFCVAAAILSLTIPAASAASTDDAEARCANLLKELKIKSGADYDAVSAGLKAKRWHQRQTTTQNIGLWTKGGRVISITLNLGNGVSGTTAGAVRCRN